MREIVTDLAHLFAEEDPESNLVPFMLTAVNDVYTLTIVYYFIHEKPDVISLYGYWIINNKLHIFKVLMIHLNNILHVTLIVITELAEPLN